MLSKELKVSVVMGVYNDEKYLENAIDSILPQLSDSMEFVIIDDCSTDGSREILQKYNLENESIRLIRNEVNRGVGYCAYLGVKEANGKYIVRADSDDLSIEHRINKQIDYLESHPDVDILGGFAIEIDENGNKGVLRKMPTSHDEIRRCIWANPIIQPSVALRRSSILKVGNYDANLRRRSDYELWFRSMAAGLCFKNLEEPLVYYRFTHKSHKKQSLKLALEQVKIGMRGCQILDLPWWTYLAVASPLIRSLLPSQLGHLLYRISGFVDPRARQSKQNNTVLADSSGH